MNTPKKIEIGNEDVAIYCQGQEVLNIEQANDDNVVNLYLYSGDNFNPPTVDDSKSGLIGEILFAQPTKASQKLSYKDRIISLLASYDQLDLTETRIEEYNWFKGFLQVGKEYHDMSEDDYKLFLDQAFEYLNAG